MRTQLTDLQDELKEVRKRKLYHSQNPIYKYYVEREMEIISIIDNIR